MKAGVKQPGKEFFTPEQCYIIEVSNSPDDEAASIARARVAPPSIAEPVARTSGGHYAPRCRSGARPNMEQPP